MCWQTSLLDSTLSIAKLFHPPVGRIRSLPSQEKTQRGSGVSEQNAQVVFPGLCVDGACIFPVTASIETTFSPADSKEECFAHTYV